MKMIVISGLAAVSLGLAGCGGQGDDTLGDRAEDQAEAQAENLEDQSEAIEEAGEEREDAIDDSDVDTDDLTEEQQNALVNGE